MVEAGVKEAAVINEYLGFQPKTKVKAIAKGAAVFQEIRYRFVNYYIRKSGYKNILDVGCGYSPRPLEFLPEGYQYVGLELPKVTDVVSEAQKKCLDESCLTNIKYESVKLTDIEEIEKDAESLVGPICIVIEGVFMYFTGEELENTLTAFRNILHRNGGCIITSDYMTNRMMKSSFVAYAGRLLGNVMVKASYQVVKRYTPRTNDPFMEPLKQFADDSDEHAKAFFEQRGLSVERVPLYVSDMPMSSL